MAFPGDRYGNIGVLKDEAPFNLAKQLQFGPNDPDGNETDVKYAISLLDDVSCVYFKDEEYRQRVIDRYHEAGITELHGIPIEKIFVSTIQSIDEAISLAWDDAIAKEQEKAS